MLLELLFQLGLARRLRTEDAFLTPVLTCTDEARLKALLPDIVACDFFSESMCSPWT